MTGKWTDHVPQKPHARTPRYTPSLAPGSRGNDHSYESRLLLPPHKKGRKPKK